MIKLANFDADIMRRFRAGRRSIGWQTVGILKDFLTGNQLDTSVVEYFTMKRVEGEWNYAQKADRIERPANSE